MNTTERADGTPLTGRHWWRTLCALILVPLLVAGTLGWATVRAEDRLPAVQAAIVNNDEPVEIDGQLAPMGRQFAAALTEGPPDSPGFTWVMTDEEGAAEGLTSGRYVARVVIPPNFSAAATSYGSEDPMAAEQATLDITTSSVTAVSDADISRQLAAAAAEAFGTELTETYLEQVYLGFNASAEGMQELADGTAELADGADQVADGAEQLTDGATEAADGAGLLAAGMGQLDTNGPTLVRGADQLAAGSSELESGLDQLRRGTADLPAQTDELASGARAVADGADELATGVDQLSGGANAVSGGARQLADGAGQFRAGADAAATGADQLAQGADQLAQGTATYRDGITAYTDGVSQAADGAGALGQGGRQLAEGTAEWADGAATYRDGIATYTDGVSQASAGADQLREGLGQATDQITANLPSEGELAQTQAVVDELVPVLEQLSAAQQDADQFASSLTSGATAVHQGISDSISQLENIRDGSLDCPSDIAAQGTQACEIWQQGAASGADEALTVLTSTDPNTGHSVLSAAAAAQSQADAFQASIDAADGEGGDFDPAHMTALIDAVQDLPGMVGDLRDGVTQLNNGVAALADGLAELDAAGDPLLSGADALATGAGSIGEGAHALADGTDQLSAGLDQLDQNSGALVEGADALASGATSVSDGADTLAGGVRQLSDGAQALDSGAASLADGADTLAAGTQEASRGAGQLADGAHQVADGTDQLAAGMVPLSDGIGQAADGSGQLADGLGAYSDGVEEYVAGVSQAADGADDLATGLGELTAGTDQLAAGSGQLADGTRELADGVAANLDAIPTYDDTERAHLASVVANPIADDNLTGVSVPRTAVGTVLMGAALWIGALGTYLGLRPLSRRLLTSSHPTADLVWATLWPGISVVAVQALGVAIIGQLMLGLGIGQAAAMVVWMLAGGVTFAVVNHALAAWGGIWGRLVAVAMLVVALVPAVTSAVPGIFDTLRPLSALTPLVDGLRTLTTGGSIVGPLLGLAAWLLCAVLASAVAVARRRGLSPAQFAATHG